MVYSLRELLNKEEIFVSFKKKEYLVKVWAGLKAPFAKVILAQKCFEPTGLFQDIIRERNIPRIVSAVFVGKDIISWAMLNDETYCMRWIDFDPQEYISLGSIGYYTVPKYRRQGWATIAIKKLDEVVDMILPENSYERYCYMGQFNVKNHQDRVCKRKVLPFGRVEDLSKNA